MSNVINAEEPVINGKYKSLSDSIMAIEKDRTDIINNINYEFDPYDFSKLTNDEYINPDKSNYISKIINTNAIIHTNTSLSGIAEKIQNIIPWQPVMQIARSASGNGSLNKHYGTATTITMYNNEVSSSFFTAADLANDANNIPLCYWGANLDSTTQFKQKPNVSPNSILFRRFSSATYKPGALFIKPGTSNNDGATIYYQFTFPYDCYVCMTIAAQTWWNMVEGRNGPEPKAFMITDGGANEKIIVARTSGDDGNGGNNASKNRYFSTIYWHGYVKQGWKLYYAEQDYWINANNTYAEWGPLGHCCLVFKIGQNNAIIQNANNNNANSCIQPILSMYRTSNGIYRTTEETGTAINVVMHNDEVSSTYIDASQTWLGPKSSATGGNIQKPIPDNPLIAKYSVAGSKGGTLFPTPGIHNMTTALYSKINVKQNGILSIAYAGGSSSEYYEDQGNSTNGEPYAFMICDKFGNPRIFRASHDNGEGINTSNSKFNSSIQYTGAVYEGETIYFAHVDRRTNTSRWQWHTSTGMSLTLYKLLTNYPTSDTLYDNTEIKQITYGQTGDGKIIANDNIYNLIKTAFSNTIADGCISNNSAYISKTVNVNSTVVITMYTVYLNYFYIIADENNNIIKIGGTYKNEPEINVGAGATAIYSKVVAEYLRKNETIYVIATGILDRFNSFASLAICQTENLVINK